jgi:hypothetical protein
MPLFSIHTSLCLFTVMLGIIVGSVYPNYHHLPFAASRINFAISSGCDTYDADYPKLAPIIIVSMLHAPVTIL